MAKRGALLTFALVFLAVTTTSFRLILGRSRIMLAASLIDIAKRYWENHPVLVQHDDQLFHVGPSKREAPTPGGSVGLCQEGEMGEPHGTGR